MRATSFAQRVLVGTVVGLRPLQTHALLMKLTLMSTLLTPVSLGNGIGTLVTSDPVQYEGYRYEQVTDEQHQSLLEDGLHGRGDGDYDDDDYGDDDHDDDHDDDDHYDDGGGVHDERQRRGVRGGVGYGDDVVVWSQGR